MTLQGRTNQTEPLVISKNSRVDQGKNKKIQTIENNTTIDQR